VALPDEESRPACDAVAQQLRDNGIPTEVAASPQKFGKQIRYAERRGIPFVWFPGDAGTHQVKDIRSGEQVDADPSTWRPPEDDVRPQVVSRRSQARSSTTGADPEARSSTTGADPEARSSTTGADPEARSSTTGAGPDDEEQDL
jgi:hypothetical protein